MPFCFVQDEVEANDERRPRVVGRDGQPVSPAQPLPISRRRATAALLQRGRSGPRIPRGSRADHLPPRAVLPAGRGRSGGLAAEQAAAASPVPAVFQPGQHEPANGRHAGLPDRRRHVGDLPGGRSLPVGLGLAPAGHEKEPTAAAHHAPQADPVDSHSPSLAITDSIP